MTSGRWPAPAKKKGERGIFSLQSLRTKITFFSDARTGGDVVAGAGVDRLGGAVLVLDLHGAGLEVAEVVGGAPLGAAGELGGHLWVIRAGDRGQRFVFFGDRSKDKCAPPSSSRNRG